MKIKQAFLLILLITAVGAFSGMVFSETTDIEKLSGPYLGQKPPGKKPEIFAPNIISTGKNEGCFIFSKDGKRLLLEIGSNVYEMLEKDGHWFKPKIVSFQSYWNVNDMTLSPDGKSVFFASRRPLKNDGMIEDFSNLWKSEMNGGEWITPIPFPASINTPLHESYTTASNTGAQYFFRYVKKPGGSENGNLYVSYFRNGSFSEAEPFDENFNTPYHEWDPYIAPDESYIIFCSLKPEGLGQDDFYISFKKTDGSWTFPMNMGEEINSPASENRPFVTLDGKYLFFSSNRVNDSFQKTSTLSAQDLPGTGNRDVYWVDASIIEDLKSMVFKAEETVPDFKTVKLTDDMFLFQGDFGNVLAFDSANGIVLIDSPISSVINLMYKEFYKGGQKQVRTLVTTHYHSDHTGANEFFGKRGVTIISQINTKKRMQSEQYNDFFNYRVPPAPENALPKLTFKDELRFQLAKEELLISYAPGHTDGDIIAYFRKANVIHMGDLFFNRYLLSCDVSAGGSIDKMIESVEKTFNIIDDSTIVIPGHGEPANKAALADYLGFLKSIRKEVSEGIDKGLSAEDIIKTRPDFLYKRKWLNISQTPDILIKNVYLDLIRFKK